MDRMEILNSIKYNAIFPDFEKIRSNQQHCKQHYMFFKCMCDKKHFGVYKMGTKTFIITKTIAHSQVQPRIKSTSIVLLVLECITTISLFQTNLRDVSIHEEWYVIHVVYRHR